MTSKTVIPVCCTESHVKSKQATEGSLTQDATLKFGRMPAVKPL